MAELAAVSPLQRDPVVQRYLDEVARYDDRFKQWTTRVEKLLQRYKDDTTDNIQLEANVKFNILWSNVQTLSAATFAKLPQADVRRRFQDQDPVGRVAALILERAITYEIEQYPDYAATLRQCILDRFLGGRGTAWARYEPHMLAVKQGLPTDGVQVTEDKDEPDEELDYECAPVDYVQWRDFGHSVARTWEEVDIVWRRVYLDKQAAMARFGEKAARLSFTADPEKDPKTYTPTTGSNANKACVYEVWDKGKKQALWFAKEMTEPLDVRDDPLGLQGFFPCPKPLYATLTGESLIPLPDFTLYQDQARLLDLCANRIDGLVKALQIRGTYDASIPVLERLFDEVNTNALTPVSNWHAFAEKGGLKGAIDLVEIEPIAQCLQHTYMAMEQIKGQVYEITGISDIIRGQTVASETATAQQLKGQYASLRLKSYQDEVSRFATDMLRLKAQIVVGKFSPDTILKMASADQLNPADQQFIQPAMQLLIGDRAMNPDAQSENPLLKFRIDIAADSMVYLDEQEEKDNRVEFLNSLGQFLGQAKDILQMAPDLAPMALEGIKFGASGFKAARSFEGVIDQTINQLQEKMAQPPEQGPSPEQMQAEQEAQLEQQRMQFEGQAEQQRLQMEQAAEQQRIALEEQAKQREMALEAQLEAMRLKMEEAEAAQEKAFKVWEAELKAETQKEVARINAGAKAAAQEQAAMAKGEEGEGEEPEEQEPEGPSETAQLIQALTAMVEQLSRPKSVVRGADGRISGLQ